MLKFTTKRNGFLDIIQTTQRAVSSKSVIPVMSGILFNVNKVVNLQATDLEMSINSTHEADIEEPGNVVLPARLLLDVIKNFNEGDIFIQTHNSVIFIRSGNAEFKLNTLPSDDFPEIKPLQASKESISVEGDMIKDGIIRVIKAVARDESRPILTGIYIKINNNDIEFATTDSYRLAVYKSTSQRVDKPKNPKSNIQSLTSSMVVPYRVMDELIKIINGNIKIDIEYDENNIRFSIGGTQLISRLIDGNYPPYNQLIPNEFKHSIKVNTSELSNSIRRMVSVAGNNPIKMVIDKDTLTVSAINQGIGEALDKIKVKFTGEPYTIAFNSNYLLDGIQACGCDEITLNLNEQNRPVLLKPAKEESFDFSYIIMPVRVNDPAP